MEVTLERISTRIRFWGRKWWESGSRDENTGQTHVEHTKVFLSPKRGKASVYCKYHSDQNPLWRCWAPRNTPARRNVPFDEAQITISWGEPIAAVVRLATGRQPGGFLENFHRKSSTKIWRSKVGTFDLEAPRDQRSLPLIFRFL